MCCTQDILKFWLVLQLFNLIGWPIAYKLFKNLPDRGYAFSRPLGLLLVSYTMWILGSLGILSNTLGGITIVMGIVIIGGWAWHQQQSQNNSFTWLKINLSYILTVELLFAVAFIGWAIFKSYTPNIETAGGEKWMEIAFINSSLLSQSFPPQDPWLAGFGISYYYFGYVMMAILTRLSGIIPTTAFNLFIPTLFALTLSGAFGLLANLIAAHQQHHPKQNRQNTAINSPLNNSHVYLGGILAAFFVGIMGHWEGVLESIHARGLLPATFWQWLDIRDLKIPPTGPGSWIPNRFIWWWRGSRVLTDYNLANNEQEVIDEFPFFSFMLGDVHPHVLTLPFVLLALAVALNLLLSKKTTRLPTIVNSDTPLNYVYELFYQNIYKPAEDGVNNLIDSAGGKLPLFIYAICLGSLGFLNTWDFPIYIAIFGLAYLAWQNKEQWFGAIIALGLFAIVSIILYLPFYLSFQSQAGGILPNLWNPTRFSHFLIFFGPFIITATLYMAALSYKSKWPWQNELKWTMPLMVFGTVFLLIILGASFIYLIPPGKEFIQGILNDPAVQNNLQGNTTQHLISEVMRRRLKDSLTLLYLTSMTGLIMAHLWSRDKSTTWSIPTQVNAAEKFSLILLFIGLGLPLSVEVLFLRDLFNMRMNTVFKFYFQAWVLLGLSSAFGIYYLNYKLKGIGQILWQGVVMLFILAGLVYPVLASRNKTGNFANPNPTLDGIAWIANQHPNDHAAILWLRENSPTNAIILERPGDSYQYLSRVSALSGRPTLVGWYFHESQWRGNSEETDKRKPHINQIYNTFNNDEALALIDQYNIDYIYIGSLEREQYDPNALSKFEKLFNVAFSQGEVVIYSTK